MVVLKKQVNQLLQESKSCFISGISFRIRSLIYLSFLQDTTTRWISSPFDFRRCSIVCCFCSTSSNSETMESPALRHLNTPSSLSSISGINSMSGSDSRTRSYVTETSLPWLGLFVRTDNSFNRGENTCDTRYLSVRVYNVLGVKSKAHLSFGLTLKASPEEWRFVHPEEWNTTQSQPVCSEGGRRIARLPGASLRDTGGQEGTHQSKHQHKDRGRNKSIWIQCQQNNSRILQESDWKHWTRSVASPEQQNEVNKSHYQ